MTEQDMQLLVDDPSQEVSLSPTRDNMLRGLQWLVAQATPGHQLFFVFCGLGAQVPVSEGPDKRLCECALVPTDATGDSPRLVRDVEIHQALATLGYGVQVTLIIDSCHAGRPLDRSMDHCFEHVSRGRVDYEKLRHHPVLPRFLEMAHWPLQPPAPSAPSRLKCQAVLWAACENPQFCVELPIDERPRGVFSYIFISSLLKVGVQASCAQLLYEAKDLTSQLKGRWRLQQDLHFEHCQATSDQQPFLRF
ncbi:unnamed protein product [Effrenium voratum]|nr:unnamed protein product [Effrenium voratum]